MGHKERETLVEPLAISPSPQLFWGAPAPHFQSACFPSLLTQCHPGTPQLHTAQQIPSYMEPGPTLNGSHLPSADHPTRKAVGTAGTAWGRFCP